MVNPNIKDFFAQNEGFLILRVKVNYTLEKALFVEDGLRSQLDISNDGQF